MKRKKKRKKKDLEKTFTFTKTNKYTKVIQREALKHRCRDRAVSVHNQDKRIGQVD